MPFFCDLKFGTIPNVVTLLKRIPNFARTLEGNTPSGNGECTINVYSFAIKEDIYGHDLYDTNNEITPEDEVFLQNYRDIDIFLPENLKTPQMVQKYLKNMIGEWNENFLRYLKHIAQECKSRIELDYLHERGDSPYEEAIWEFNYAESATINESFSLLAYDVDSWKASVYKMRDGIVIKSFDGMVWDDDSNTIREFHL